jgi:hypothetical protein
MPSSAATPALLQTMSSRSRRQRRRSGCALLAGGDRNSFRNSKPTLRRRFRSSRSATSRRSPLTGGPGGDRCGCPRASVSSQGGKVMQMHAKNATISQRFPCSVGARRIRRPTPTTSTVSAMTVSSINPATDTAAQLVRLPDGEYTHASVLSDPTEAARLALVKEPDGNYGRPPAPPLPPAISPSAQSSSPVLATLESLKLGGL